jgi:putative restriction endonuclease
MDDREIRQAAFSWLEEQKSLNGESLLRDGLAHGFDYKEQRIRLVGPQGIFKPQCLQLPLSITTVAGGPYSDTFRSDGLLSYRYRGHDPMHRDNVGLRSCMLQRKPLIYFHGIGNARYVPSWPAFIVADDQSSLTFTVAVDDSMALRQMDAMPATSSVQQDSAIRRGYITALTKRRIHQQAFRERVLTAYRQQCSLCRLKHGLLLDAAHIVPDSDPEGEPVTSNGIALCKLHHAAFDRHFLAVRPDYRIEIRADVLEETDGPMLKHGLQGLHLLNISLPAASTNWPNRVALEDRYHKFLEVSRR